MHSNDPNLRRVFQDLFQARDVAQPLPSFDAATPAGHVREIMERNGFDVAGIRTAGTVTGFVEKGDPGEACIGDVARSFDDVPVVTDTLPLDRLVLRLKEVPRLFVSIWGQVGGLATRFDLQKPPARMWLFGVVTLIEMRLSQMIEQQCPGDTWRPFLSEGRIQKAQELLAERSRRNQQLSLTDCLQFSDKTQIIARNEQLRGQTRFTSRRQAEEVGKRLEKLRNNLAHAQELIPHDWDTIVALAENVDSLLA